MADRSQPAETLHYSSHPLPVKAPQAPGSHLRVVAMLRVGQHLANVLSQCDGAAAKLHVKVSRAASESELQRGRERSAEREATAASLAANAAAPFKAVRSGRCYPTVHTWMMVRRWRARGVSGSFTTPAAAACAASTCGSWLCSGGLIRPERSTEMMCSCSCCGSAC